jgi:hypothetical protein
LTRHAADTGDLVAGLAQGMIRSISIYSRRTKRWGIAILGDAEC